MTIAEQHELGAREPVTLDYRGPANQGAEPDEYGFIHEVFGWFLVTLLLIAVCVAMGLGVSALVWAIK